MPPLVLIGRPAEKVADAVRTLEENGLVALPVPLIRIVPNPSPLFDRFLAALKANELDVVVFASSSGLDAAADLAEGRFSDFLDALRARHRAAIGPATADALSKLRLAPTFVAQEHSSVGLVRELGSFVKGKYVAVLRSTEGDPALVRGLEHAGASVLDVPVYRVERPTSAGEWDALRRALAEGRIAGFAFTSAKTVAHLFDWAAERDETENLRKGLAAGVVAAIGPPTAEALVARGVRVDVLPAEATFPALVRTLAVKLHGRGPSDAKATP